MEKILKRSLSTFFQPPAEFWVVFPRDLDRNGLCVDGQLANHKAVCVPHGKALGDRLGLWLFGRAGSGVEDDLKPLSAGRFLG